MFGVEGQPEPNYEDPRDWKRLKLFPGKIGSKRGSSGKTDPYTSVESSAMSAPITKMKKALHITAPKVLHGGRRSGARHLQARLTSHPGIDGIDTILFFPTEWASMNSENESILFNL